MTHKRTLSLKSRLLWVLVPIGILVVLVTGYSQYAVDQMSEEAIQSVSEIRLIERKTNTIRTTLHNLQSMTYERTVINYSDEEYSTKQIESVIKSLKHDLNVLVNNQHIKSAWAEKKDTQDSVSSIIFQLNSSLRSLTRYIKYYLLVVDDVDLRFPGRNHLVEGLLPANRQFLEAVDQAIIETRSESHITDRDKQVLLLHEIRYLWAQQVSWFRMFVANRSGIFGSPDRAMEINLNTRSIFINALHNKMKELDKYYKRQQLGFQSSVSYEIMVKTFDQYERQMEEASKIYMSNEWRIDQVFLEENLLPEFRRIHRLLDILDQHIKSRAANTITRSYQTSQKINTYLWGLGIVILIMMAITYFGFELLVRKPMALLAEALHAEARGSEAEMNFKMNTAETRSVYQAFTNMQEQVRVRQDRLRSVLDNAAEGIITLDENGRIETFNNAAESLFGYPEDDILGKNINLLLPYETTGFYKNLAIHNAAKNTESNAVDTPLMGKRKNGSLFSLSFKVTELIQEGRHAYIAIVEDVSERLELIKNLRNLAEHDSLTGLHNRHFFLQEMQRLTQRISRRNDIRASLLYIDLDNFKYVNDTMGHLAGDKLLIEVATLLKSRSRKSDLIVRLGGDEFAVILYDVEDSSAMHVAESYRATIQDYHFTYEGKIVDIGCSIGVASIEFGAEKEDILSRADYACHAAKRAGRNRIHVYSDVDKQNIDTISDDMGWARRIKEAIEYDRFMVVMQPIMNAHTGAINRFELLLRMLDDKGKFIMPSGFLPPAERFNLMRDIDKWVVHHAFEMLAKHHPSLENMELAINLSAPSFDTEEIIDLITAKIEQTRINPSLITFEITETVAMNDIGTTSIFLTKLRELGCKTALDDFGVGYSSFAYLKELPVDYVKIDGSFVHDIDKSDLNKAIVKSMHDVANAMGKKTVAEFVGSERVAEMLKLMGVDYLQGYYIGEPEIPVVEKMRIPIGRNQNTA